MKRSYAKPVAVAFWMALLIAGRQAEAIECYDCHGSSSPRDYRPIDDGYRNITTGGFRGNHRTHMDAAAVPATCARCHPGSGSYKTSHMDGFIKVAANVNASPFGARYRNTTAPFPQTSTPSLGTCSNVNCHFEKETPTWGDVSFTSPGACGSCHGSPPAGGDSGNAGSHGRHYDYYGGVAACSLCHSDHLNEPNPFGHATSAARRPLTMRLHDPSGVPFGAYSGSMEGNYLPKSRTRQISGACTTIYCHSDGTSVSTGTIRHNSTPLWGSRSGLACNECHGYPPAYESAAVKANSHPIHVTHSLSDCSICHYGTTSTGTAITDTSRHVNKSYDVQAGPPYSLTYSYSPGGGSCTNISCHNDARWGSGSPGGSGCITCHGHSAGFEYEPGKFSQGKGSWRTHATHTQSDGANVKGPNIACNTCHDTENYPFFRSGTDANGDARFSLAETDVCDACHSPGGGYDGVDDAAIGARPNWKTGIYDGSALKPGKGNWCLTCHDAAPAVIKGKTAPNKAGDNAGYGWYATGHGRNSSFPRMSWQNNAAAGNPGANRGCMDCHDGSMGHIDSGSGARRLKAGYENDDANSNCGKCHATGGMANNGPAFFTTTSAYRASAHRNTKCTQCHEVHGSSGAFTGMSKGDRHNLCAACHSNGGHPGVGTTSFTADGKTYTLQCTSCHNVHVITGKYSDAAQNKSPVSRITSNLNVWGAAAGEKMNAYAGSGTYRKPNGESFTGDQLPDYATFCLDCHAQSQTGNPSAFGISWNGDPHGKEPANAPDGYGVCPNWFACGKATGWDGDDCKGGSGEFSGSCWPVTPKGAGDELFSREPYTHTERIAGANFTLSCTDCHTGHGTGTLGRPNVNGGGFTSNWNDLCNRCHYYYSDWHAGMSCGNASCHETNSIHRMKKNHGSGATRSHEPGLVLHYAFENNLKDSGSWQLDGKWMDNLSGSFAAGKTGQALVLSGGRNVQVGTENDHWSTDEGYHGTWKYTEMKYNTTLEAWVRPTADQEYHTVFSKHTGYGSGGYEFALRKIGGTLRAVFYMQADNNGAAQDGRAGVRGAYSTAVIPLNAWTHVAATFDGSGPDRDPGDPAVGRIRIYVNGQDTTTSDSSGNLMQPGTGETSIFAYSENSPWNQSICYDGQWCASELAIGGFYGWQSEFVGYMDEAKIWNITKPVSYFDAIDAADPPRIISAVKGTPPDRIVVTFNEGVYANGDGTGNLQPSAFIYTDLDNGRTITAVTHTAGGNMAVLTLSSPLDYSNDIGVDTVAAASGRIFDRQGAAMGTTAATINGDDGTAPSIVSASVTGANKVTVSFSEGVYGAIGGTGDLQPDDFVLTDNDDHRTITAVTHTAGGSTATLTLSASLDSSDDIGVDTVAAAPSAIFDDLGRAMAATAVTITGSLCPTEADFQMNWPGKNVGDPVLDESGLLTGVIARATGVSGTLQAIAGDGVFHGDGPTSKNYIAFQGQPTCLQANTALTIEARIQPQGIANDKTTNYARRIFLKADSSTPTPNEIYHLTVWRLISSTNWPNYQPAENGIASIALWTKPVDAHGGAAWKPVLTEATNSSSSEYCPIQNNHWYNVKAVWNTASGGASGHPVADVLVEDQGTDGNGTGQRWTGVKNCTDADQSQLTTDKRFASGDAITAVPGKFILGGPANDANDNHFYGLIDWVRVKDTAQ